MVMKKWHVVRKSKSTVLALGWRTNARNPKLDGHPFLPVFLREGIPRDNAQGNSKPNVEVHLVNGLTLPMNLIAVNRATRQLSKVPCKT